jgi:hypothetical protein
MSRSRTKRFSGDLGNTIRFRRSFWELIPHLYVIVTPPYGDPPQVVIVGFTTKHSTSDTTVVLRPRHHPFFDRETAANYAQASIQTIEALKERIEDGIAEVHEPFSESDLKVIQKGLLQSKRTPRYIQQYCRQFCGQQCE